MGYNLYLVKTLDVLDEANKFTATEWTTLCATHQVAEWLYFDGDAITVKNPSEEQVAALVRIAKSCGWTVQGDDGETYAEDGSFIPSAPAPRPGLLGRLMHFLSRHRTMKATQKLTREITCAFSVGDKVRTTHRSGGVVISVDPSGHHGMGNITVRFPDGVTLSGMFTANGFQKEP
jgi:hypothetical protein